MSSLPITGVSGGYQILVASSLDKLDAGTGDVWDSGLVKSENSVLVSYRGKPLESRKTYYWKVRVKTNKGDSEWSQPSLWSMAFTDQSDWNARWTGLDKSFPGDKLEGKTRLAARYFRKEFKTDQKDIAKATLYVSGLGLYQAVINGSRVGDQALAPTPTFYTKNIKYNTHDVTNLLSGGDNAIAVTLGNGRFFNLRTGHEKTHIQPHFGFPKMLLQLEIDYADGSRQTIISDDSWKVTADGPIISNYTDNLRGALATDLYTLKGDRQETWEPVFTYHGFRYVEITGFPGTPTPENFEGLVVYDEMPVAGHFETSDATINQIYKIHAGG